MDGERILVVSPHFDDAVLSCWSVLARAGPVEVLNVFTGEPGPGAPLHDGELLTGATDGRARARERADEDAAALELVGARPRNLGLLEHAHSTGGRGPFARRSGGLDRRVRALRAEAVGALDAGARLYVPAALGAHPDHVLVRELGCRLAREGARVSFYADQPYCYAYGWPSWVTGEEPDPHLDVDGFWRRELEPAGVDFGELRTEVVSLGAAEHDAKLEALRRYRTQFAVLEGGPNRRLSNRELSGREVFWHTAARGAEVADGLA